MSVIRAGTAGANRFGGIPGVDHQSGYQPGDTLIGLGGDDTCVLFVHGLPGISDPRGNPPATIAEAPGGGFGSVRFSFGDRGLERTCCVLPAGTEAGVVTCMHTLFYGMAGNDRGNLLDISGQIEGIVVADPACVVEAFRLLPADGGPSRITDLDAAPDRIEASAAGFGGGPAPLPR